MSKASEAELVQAFSMLFAPVFTIGTLVFLCIYISNRFFKRKGKQ